MNVGSKTGYFTGPVTVEEGELWFDESSLSSSLFTGGLTVKGSGVARGRGLLSSLTVEEGGEVDLKETVIGNPGTIQASMTANVQEGGQLTMTVKRIRNNNYSQLLARFLTLNGTVKVQLLSSYNPKVGDELALWTATSSISGTPTLDLPALPEGLAWDTSALVDADGKALKAGVLKVVEATADGIVQHADDVSGSYEVYTFSGVRVGSVSTSRAKVRPALRSMGLRPGLYIVKRQGDGRAVTETVMIK
jgi:hypothetical protein